METLDSLRGLAIVLMIIDHLAWVAGVMIQPDTIRIWTRLSMPLFCVLMGYFLACKEVGLPLAPDRQSAANHRPNWQRWGQLVIAATAVNAFYFPLEGQFEILVSLAIAWLIWAGVRVWIVAGAAAFLLFPLDPTAGSLGSYWFDYPLSLVLTCVAQGFTLRLWGPRIALSVSAATAAVVYLSATIGLTVVAAPSSYVLIAAPAAVALTALGVRLPHIRLLGLDWIGRHPLSVYVVQYWIILAIRALTIQ